MNCLAYVFECLCVAYMMLQHCGYEFVNRFIWIHVLCVGVYFSWWVCIYNLYIEVYIDVCLCVYHWLIKKMLIAWLSCILRPQTPHHSGSWRRREEVAWRDYNFFSFITFSFLDCFPFSVFMNPFSLVFLLALSPFQSRERTWGKKRARCFF